MKRSLFGLTFVAVALVGPSLAQDAKPISFQSNLLPLNVGNKWVYQGNEPKDRITVTVERMELVRRRVPTARFDRTESIESFILRTTNGDKSLREQILVVDDGIYRYAAAGKELTPPLKILKLPPARGDTWPCESTSENVVIKGEMVVDQEDVSLPKLGTVKAWVSRTRDFTVDGQEMQAAYWFAPNVGIVKQHVKVGKFELHTTLEEFKPASANAAPTQTLPGIPVPPPSLDLK